MSPRDRLFWNVSSSCIDPDTMLPLDLHSKNVPLFLSGRGPLPQLAGLVPYSLVPVSLPPKMKIAGCQAESPPSFSLLLDPLNSADCAFRPHFFPPPRRSLVYPARCSWREPVFSFTEYTATDRPGPPSPPPPPKDAYLYHSPLKAAHGRDSL